MHSLQDICSMAEMKVLFVCLGNICRSPLAEELFRNHVRNQGHHSLFLADSAGTSDYHTGESPDRRTIRNAGKHGLELNHRARQFTGQDFVRFDHIIAMDRNNYTHITEMAKNQSDLLKVRMMRDFDPEFPGHDVPDPWAEGEQAFEEVFHILDRSTGILMNWLLKKS